MSVVETEPITGVAEAPEGEHPPERSSYEQILRATGIVGGGKVVIILIGLVRSKVLAILLGPAGIGLMGLLLSVMETGATLFGLGMRQSGVRQIAAAGGDAHKLSTVRRALWRSNLVLGVAGLIVLWMLNEPISQLVFGDTSRAADVTWMGVGVLISLIAASQTALLQGMRRIGDLVKAGLFGALLGTAVGIAIVWYQGEPGVRWFVLATPVSSVLGAAWYARKLPRPTEADRPGQAFWEQWREMAVLGGYLMITGLAASLTALAVRSILTHKLGVEAAGQFQAAHAISGNYLGLVLGAMTADYYPRLTRLMDDRSARNQAVNDQLEVALVLIAPLLLAVLALAPWVLRLLYTSDFQIAAGILRWQILGDVLKVASWATVFLILAAGDGKLYLLTELTTHAVFVGALLALLPVLGLEAAGVAFWVQYVYYFPLVWWLVRRRYGFSMRGSGRAYLAGLFGAALLITAVSSVSELAACGAGLLLAAIAGLLAIQRIDGHTRIFSRWLK